MGRLAGYPQSHDLRSYRWEGEGRATVKPTHNWRTSAAIVVTRSNSSEPAEPGTFGRVRSGPAKTEGDRGKQGVNLPSRGSLRVQRKGCISAKKREKPKTPEGCPVSARTRVAAGKGGDGGGEHLSRATCREHLPPNPTLPSSWKKNMSC